MAKEFPHYKIFNSFTVVNKPVHGIINLPRGLISNVWCSSPMLFVFKQVSVWPCVLATIVKLQNEPGLSSWFLAPRAGSHVFNGLSTFSRYQRKSGAGLHFVSQINVTFSPDSAVMTWWLAPSESFGEPLMFIRHV